MDERDKTEQQTTNKKHRKKSDHRSKLNFGRLALFSTTDSWIKFPHVTSKARAFFRSLDFKHHQHSISISTSSSSNEDEQKHEITLNPIPLTTNVSISRVRRVDKINPRDLVVHRVAEFNDKPPLNYFQEKYRQYLKPSLLIPKQYYHEILHQKQMYSPPPPPICSTRTEPLPDVPRASSISTWNQCVRRLNREYRLTLEVLEQTRQSLEEIYTKSKPPLERKKPSSVRFCLPIEFTKPKIIKPVELDQFHPKEDLSIVETDEKIESISVIIKKFNELNENLSSLSTETPRVRFQIPDLVLPNEEETTYTVETFYKDNSDSSIEHENIVVIQEKTTEEQFNAIQSREIFSKPLKNSLIPKRILTNDIHLSKLPTKTFSSISKIKPPSTIKPIVYQKQSTNNSTFITNRVKTH